MALGKSFLAIGYSLLVLLSGFSWHVEEHHCMGRVMDRAFLGEAESCGMEEARAIFGESEEEGCVLFSTALDCCQDQTFAVEKQDELKDQVAPVVYLTPIAPAVPAYSFPIAPKAEQAPAKYRPPPLPSGKQRLHWLQTYLI